MKQASIYLEKQNYERNIINLCIFFTIHHCNKNVYNYCSCLEELFLKISQLDLSVTGERSVLQNRITRKKDLYKEYTSKVSGRRWNGFVRGDEIIDAVKGIRKDY